MKNHRLSALLPSLVLALGHPLCFGRLCRSFLAASLLVLPSVIRAELVLYEPFNYPVNAVLKNSSPWSEGMMSSGAGGDITLQTGSLSVQGLAGGWGNRAQVADPNADNAFGTAHRSMPEVNLTDNGQQFWLSFVIRAEDMGTHTFNDLLNFGSTSGYSTVRLNSGTQAGTFRMSILKGSSGGGVTFSSNYSLHTNHLVVLRLVRNNFSSQPLSMWVNPDPASFGTGAAPTGATAITNDQGGGTLLFNWLRLTSQGLANSVFVDELRAGRTWADVSPPAPAIAVESPGGIVASGAAFDFGVVSVGNTGPSETFTIHNNGIGELNIAEIGISSGGAQSSQFILDNSTMLSTVPPGGSTTFAVSFAPNQVGVASGDLTVQSNDPEIPVFTLHFTGRDPYPFSASNLSTAGLYTVGTGLSLTPIVVGGDVESATVTLTLVIPAAGSLNTGTSGAVTSTYDPVTGVWSVSGAVADVNALLAGLTFTPAPGFNGSFTIIASATDGSVTFSGAKSMTSTTAPALHEFVDPNPNPGNQFGHSVVPLSSGNVVITSPRDDAGGTDAGAVYLFNGATGALISRLTGNTAGDRVGQEGVTALSNGNYVVRSRLWDNGSVADAGAVTFGSGTTGVSGVISAANSLVGSKASDQVGSSGVTVLSNGNYVVKSPGWDSGSLTDVGAATFGNGTTGASGEVSAANSLVGSKASDQVGIDGVMELSNGNYVVSSRYWDNGAVADAGAATFGNGTTGVSGVISAANSLVGSKASDQVGSSGVTVLSNGNYVVRSPGWNNGAVTNAGAVTFGSGTTGVSGVVSAANSLVGSTANDQVGNFGVIVLSNGNYVVTSPYWDNGAVTNAGAVTFGSGTTGVSGVVSAANSLVGSTANDRVGFNSVTPLSNGNYVVSSRYWDYGAVADAGAATFGNGTTGASGEVSAANSLVGSKASDQVGSSGVTVLSNGNYVVRSPGWNNGAGAATFGNGTTGVSGEVSTANSLVGPKASDTVGFGVTALSNGNYVVRSPFWDNDAVTDAGAVTFGSGTTGVSGEVSAANSLVGSTANDSVGINNGVTALSNGNYVVSSHYWDNGAVADAGAATFGNGTTGVSGVISAANSLVGSMAGDQVGGTSVTALSNGNYVASSPNWDNGAVVNAGAATFGNGTTGVSGVVSAANSLVGSTANDRVASSGVIAQSNGNYVVRSPDWNNGAVTDAGAATFSSGTTGVSGVVSAANSLVGSTANDSVGINSVTQLSNGNYVVTNLNWHNGTAIGAGAVTFGSSTTGVSGIVTSANSARGAVAISGMQSVVEDMVNGNFFARFLNEGSGKVRVGSVATGFAPVAQEITVFTGDNTADENDRTDSLGTVDFGNLVGGSSAAQTFTIRNSGIAELTHLAVNATGTNGTDYAVDTTGLGSSLAPGATATFTVAFAPIGPISGTRSAVIEIGSNDVDENPFRIPVTGTFTPPTANITFTLEQPVGTPLAFGDARAFTMAMGTDSVLVFTIRNTGDAMLDLMSVSLDGADAGDFAIVDPIPGVAPGASTTFSVRFAPESSGLKTAILQISSNDPDDSPFYIMLSGRALSFTEDSDGDGLNDATEFQMAALGFNWEQSQPELVNTLFDNVNGAQANLNAQGYLKTTQQSELNAQGYFTADQVHGLHVNTPLIQRNAGNGEFTLTLGLEKSTTLQPGSFQPFPFNAPATSVNGEGKIQFQFTSPDDAAFFRLGAE